MGLHRIRLVDLNGEEIPGAVYGKVVEQVKDAGFVVRFTSPAPEILKLLRRAR